MTDELQDVLSALLAPHGLELVDLEVGPGLVRATVDREGGIDLEGLAAANRTVSSALDDLDPFPGRYTLEVSSPGVERRLRTPRHFRRALGETVSVRLLPGAPEPGTAAGAGTRRLQGRLAGADDSGFLIEGDDVPGGSLHVAYDRVDRARTVFEWGAKKAPSPSRGTPHRGGRGTTSGRGTSSGGRGAAATPRTHGSEPEPGTTAQTERVTTP